MESVMIIRRSLLACLALGAGLLLRGDPAAAGYQADTTTRSAVSRSADPMVGRMAQDDDSGNAQTPDATATPDAGNEDNSQPAQDQE
jgi:hypothetical protein